MQNDFISHDPMRGSISTAELAGTDILNVISLAGGNHCGIFVSSVNSAGQAVANKIKVGDNIMKVNDQTAHFEQHHILFHFVLL